METIYKIDFTNEGVSVNGGARAAVGAFVITENGVEMGANSSGNLADMKEKTLELARKIGQGQCRQEDRITEV